MNVTAQFRAILLQLNDEGRSWQELSEIFEHDANWAWRTVYKKKRGITLDDGVVNGLRKLGYDLRITKIEKEQEQV